MWHIKVGMDIGRHILWLILDYFTGSEIIKDTMKKQTLEQSVIELLNGRSTVVKTTSLFSVQRSSNFKRPESGWSF